VTTIDHLGENGGRFSPLTDDDGGVVGDDGGGGGGSSSSSGGGGYKIIESSFEG